MKKILGGIWLILTLDCEQSARLASDSFDRKLGWWESAALKIHVSWCRESRRLTRQMSMMREALRGIDEGAITTESNRLSSTARSRIRDALQRQCH